MGERIVVVEDEPDLSALVGDYVFAAGYEAALFADGRKALADVRHRLPDLIVLDLMLPGLDGLSFCTAVRAFSDVPIIMVTAKVEEIDRLLGLETGADDYLCKPFSPRELVARIRAVLRRRRQSVADVPLLVVDEASRRIRIGAQRLELTPTEYSLLAAMAQRPGTIFSRAQLLDVARRDRLDVNDRAIDSHIKNLRRKLVAVLPDAEVIHAVYGLGYRVEF